MQAELDRWVDGRKQTAALKARHPGWAAEIEAAPAVWEASPLLGRIQRNAQMWQELGFYSPLVVERSEKMYSVRDGQTDTALPRELTADVVATPAAAYRVQKAVSRLTQANAAGLLGLPQATIARLRRYFDITPTPPPPKTKRRHAK